MTLLGMTWNHARAIDPLLAASSLWYDVHGVAIEWDVRSLQEFESTSITELAQRYDLMVIDHPHVGAAVAAGALAPFDTASLPMAVGQSLGSYQLAGKTWALPIDAAAQVIARRPDRINRAPVDWPTLQSILTAGEGLIPFRSPHGLMTLFTLCGLLGQPPQEQGDTLFDTLIAPRAYDLLTWLYVHSGDSDFSLDPIAVLDRLSERQGRWILAAFVYGYVTYSLPGRPVGKARLAFSDLVSPTGNCAGSTLGGTGIAVAADSSARDEGMAFATWLASAPVQSDLLLRHGGQPAHAAAWEVGHRIAEPLFFASTRLTIDGGWVRPRYDGYIAFQQSASEYLEDALKRGDAACDVLSRLNAMYVSSRETF